MELHRCKTWKGGISGVWEKDSPTPDICKCLSFSKNAYNWIIMVHEAEGREFCGWCSCKETETDSLVKGFNGCWVLENMKDIRVWFLFSRSFRKSFGHLLNVKYCFRCSDPAIKKKKNHSVPQRLECDCNDNNWAINYEDT